MIKFVQNFKHLNALHRFDLDMLREHNHEHSLVGLSFFDGNPGENCEAINCPSLKGSAFAVERDQDAPAQVKEKNRNLKAKSVFRICKTATRACAPDWQVFHFQNALTGDIMEVEMPLPRHWVAGSQNTHVTSRPIHNSLGLGIFLH